jgi:HAD superfamily hydrolase (TIGR01509 family)
MTDSQRRRAVLVDVDGTLVDTTYLHAVAWWQALSEYGHNVPMQRIHRAIGMGTDTLLDHLLGDRRDRDDDVAISSAHAALAAVHWPALRPTRGAADLLRACAAGGFTVVLASSAQDREMVALRRAIGADDVISDVTTADDASRSKPAPDIIVAALKRAGVEPSDAVYVGDSLWDAHAATGADVACIGVTCGGTSSAELIDAGMLETYADPADLLAKFDRSVLAGIGGRAWSSSS